MDCQRPWSLWRLWQTAAELLRRAIIPWLTLNAWLKQDGDLYRYRDSPRKRRNQAAHALNSLS